MRGPPPLELKEIGVSRSTGGINVAGTHSIGYPLKSPVPDFAPQKKVPLTLTCYSSTRRELRRSTAFLNVIRA